MRTKTIVSTPSPTIVEPIVRIQSDLPFIQTFILESTNELQNSPIKNAIMEPATILGTKPRIVAYASCPVQNEAAGRFCTKIYAKLIKISATKPDQIIFRVAR